MQAIKQAQAMLQESARTIAGLGAQAGPSIITDLPVESPFKDPVNGAHQALVGRPRPDFAGSMVDTIVASRSYEANVSAVKILHDMARETTRLL